MDIAPQAMIGSGLLLAVPLQFASQLWVSHPLWAAGIWTVYGIGTIISPAASLLSSEPSQYAQCDPLNTPCRGLTNNDLATNTTTFWDPISTVDVISTLVHTATMIPTNTTTSLARNTVNATRLTGPLSPLRANQFAFSGGYKNPMTSYITQVTARSIPIRDSQHITRASDTANYTGSYSPAVDFKLSSGSWSNLTSKCLVAALFWLILALPLWCITQWLKIGLRRGRALQTLLFGTYCVLTPFVRYVLEWIKIDIQRVRESSIIVKNGMHLAHGTALARQWMRSLAWENVSARFRAHSIQLAILILLVVAHPLCMFLAIYIDGLLPSSEQSTPSLQLDSPPANFTWSFTSLALRYMTQTWSTYNHLVAIAYNQSTTLLTSVSYWIRNNNLAVPISRVSQCVTHTLHNPVLPNGAYKPLRATDSTPFICYTIETAIMNIKGLLLYLNPVSTMLSLSCWPIISIITNQRCPLWIQQSNHIIPLMSLTALFWLNFFAVAKWPLSQSRTPIAYVQRFAFPVVLVLLPLLGLWVFAHYTRGWSLGEILFAVLTTSAMTLWSPRTVERWRGFLGVPMLTGEVLR